MAHLRPDFTGSSEGSVDFTHIGCGDKSIVRAGKRVEKGKKWQQSSQLAFQLRLIPYDTLCLT